MTEDACGECVLQIIFRCCITAAVIFTEIHIVPRRAAIIRQGRLIQDWLHIPEPVRIFSETNPGMVDRDIRLGTGVIGISAFLSILGILAIVSRWPSWPPAFFWLEGVSFCIVVLAWLRFALARRRRQASQTAKGYGSIVADEEDLEEARPPEFDLRDPEINATILGIWADIWM